MPKDAVLLSTGGLTTSALARRGGGSRVAFVRRGAVRRLETAQGGLNGRKPRFGHKIAMRRYRPVGKFGLVVLVFSDEGAAHFELPVLSHPILAST
jgi:hypothetical protein